MRRILCVWLPGWPIQRLRRRQPERKIGPLVLFASGSRTAQVTACSPGAWQRGVRVGMSLAEARALGARHAAPMQFEPHERKADHMALRKLAHWCQRFGPFVALEESATPESLLLDVTGCGAYFGGEDVLMANVVEAFAGLGYQVRVALADTIGAAWGVSHHASGEGPTVVAAGRQMEALRPLPVEALRLSPVVVERLHEFGLRHIHQLLALPRTELVAGFTAEVVDRLDQAEGTRAELLTPETEEERLEASWQFEPPLSQRRMVDEAFWRLLQQILMKLRGRDFGVQRLLCQLRTTEEQPVQLEVGLLRPSVCADHLLELWRLQFERCSLEGEVASLCVRVTATMPLEFFQGQLFEANVEAERQRHLCTLMERLSNRLGEQAVLRARLWPDAQPECAYRYEPWLQDVPVDKRRELRQSASGPCRPLWLFPEPVPVLVTSESANGPPIRFQWQAQEYEVIRTWGPERIATGWWRGDDVRRDYYVVETADGQRFWLYRTLRQEAWFLHGTYV